MDAVCFERRRLASFALPQRLLKIMKISRLPLALEIRACHSVPRTFLAESATVSLFYRVPGNNAQ